MINYSQYFLAFDERSESQAIEQATKENPLPVQSVPYPPSPAGLVNTTITGLVYGVIITIIINLGKPFFEFIQSLTSEKARERVSREKQAQEAQIQLHETLNTYQSDQKAMQTSLLKLVTDSQAENHRELTKVFTSLYEELSKIEKANRENTVALGDIVRGHKALKIEIVKGKIGRVFEDESSEK
jgi:uncharacterized protein HemX